MKELILNLPLPQEDTRVSIGEDAVAALWERLPDAFVIADKAMRELVPQRYYPRTALIQAGEETKSMAMLEKLVKWLAGKDCKRDSALVALGGGTIGDIAGFAAGIYMRGIEWHIVPTTLLAMVDSSIGGKTAANVGNVKNMVGLFRQPASVAINPLYLRTLTEEAYMSGVGEILKAAIIDGELLYDMLLYYKHYVDAREPGALADMIHMACGIKADIVAADPFENGRRVVLNAGHTIAHAIEADSGFVIPHGLAVATGMVMETKAAVLMGIAEAETAENVANIIGTYGFDLNYSFQGEIEIGHDKKQRSEYLVLPVIEEVGRVMPHKIERERFIEAVVQANQP